MIQNENKYIPLSTALAKYGIELDKATKLFYASARKTNLYPGYFHPVKECWMVHEIAFDEFMSFCMDQRNIECKEKAEYIEDILSEDAPFTNSQIGHLFMVGAVRGVQIKYGQNNKPRKKIYAESYHLLVLFRQKTIGKYKDQFDKVPTGRPRYSPKKVIA